jgi:REP element-mobilizing transposase RayT
MGYPRRDDGPHLAHHISAKGNNGQAIFRTIGDRERWLAVLSDVCDRYGWKVHAYVEMSNHYHALVSTEAGMLAPGTRWLNGRFARDRNVEHGRTGHLFGRRVWSEPIDELKHFHNVARYIHRNPVRAGLVRRAEAYTWSSMPGIVGRADRPWFLEAARVLAPFGDDPEGAAFAYAEAVAIRDEDEDEDGIENIALNVHAIRAAVASGHSITAVASMVGVHRSTIHRLLNKAV